EKFDPAKITSKILVDVTMDDRSCFAMPVDGKINSKFGWRRGRVHSGIDLDLETGDPVSAALDGTVIEANYSGGYGNLVVLKHENGLETYYAHLSKIKVEPGQKVEAGELIGLGGSTGRSTGPHLHFEVRYLGAAFDPSYLIDFDNQQLRSNTIALEKSTFKVINEKASTQYYTVRSGDTLSKIAGKYGTSVSQICKLNGISSKKIIKPGMKLRVR
ncbi:MAG: peptidoglycan DD-metalloendopeptidase family protein, partial [Chitinophagales bacterium]